MRLILAGYLFATASYEEARVIMNECLELEPTSVELFHQYFPAFGKIPEITGILAEIQSANDVKHIQLFLKGMAMGAADVVPGVSGGTIAFITGIYERLIGAISSINKQTLLMLFKGQFRQLWTAIDGTFLAVLFAGIFTSILTLASVLTFTLEHYPILTWSFFFGLVAASVWMMGRTVKQWNAQAVVAFVLGTIVAYAITEMNATAGSEAPWYLILSGALAICAMILPGISGSFILLLLGAYSTVLAAVANRELLTIAYVGIGAVLGLLLFSKGLKYIFERFYNPTIALLSGFLLGSLE